mmetsp:Transcript_4371/g.8360  ORF Transcript_4371/g.8360 Transcript_4371/m.8360 type:complete len:275 (+) Transcript_4371:33-857(+)
MIVSAPVPPPPPNLLTSPTSFLTRSNTSPHTFLSFSNSSLSFALALFSSSSSPALKSVRERSDSESCDTTALNASSSFSFLASSAATAAWSLAISSLSPFLSASHSTFMAATLPSSSTTQSPRSSSASSPTMSHCAPTSATTFGGGRERAEDTELDTTSTAALAASRPERTGPRAMDRSKAVMGGAEGPELSSSESSSLLPPYSSPSSSSSLFMSPPAPLGTTPPSSSLSPFKDLTFLRYEDLIQHGLCLKSSASSPPNPSSSGGKDAMELCDA